MTKKLNLNPQPEPPGISFLSKLGINKTAGWFLGGLGLATVGAVIFAAQQGYIFSTRSVLVTVKPKLIPGPFKTTVSIRDITTSTFAKSYSGVSNSTKSTGLEVNGLKATGSIEFNNSKCRTSVQLDQNTVFTWTQTSKTFKLNQSTPVTLTGSSPVSVPVIATDIGPDYNAPVGQTWSINDTCITSNPSNPGSTSGGFKESLAQVSQTDVDTAVKNESLKLFKINRDDADKFASVNGQIPIVGSETFKVTKSISKPVVDSQATTFVVGVDIEISVLTASPTDLLAAIKTAQPKVDATNWVASGATDTNGSVEITGQGNTIPATIDTASIKNFLTKNNPACNGIHFYLSTIQTVEKFNVVGKPDCTDKVFKNIAYTVEVSDTGY
jgi:hypothetical protein